MYTHRVQILHAADDNAVVLAVSDNLVLNFLPACHRLLQQYLPDGALLHTHLAEVLQLLVVVGDSAACTAECVCRSDDNRVSYFPNKFLTFLQGCCYCARRNRFADVHHQFLEGFSVFCLVNALFIDTQKLAVVFLEHTLFVQCHSQVQTCLSAKACKYSLWFLFLQDFYHCLFCDRLQVDLICDPLVCHYGCRVAVNKYSLDSLLGDSLACLGSGIVEFCGLPDYYRTGADYQNLIKRKISRHYSVPPSIKSMNLSNR